MIPLRQISGPQLDDEPVAPFVNGLDNLLAYTNMEAVLGERDGTLTLRITVDAG